MPDRPSATRRFLVLGSGRRPAACCNGWIEAARKDMQRHTINLPDRDLACFSEGTELFDDYVEAVESAQDYARLNRHEFEAQIAGAECRKDSGVIDELKKRGSLEPRQLGRLCPSRDFAADPYTQRSRRVESDGARHQGPADREQRAGGTYAVA
jgi:hypothetical protein